MTLKQLEYFLAIAENGSITKAANSLRISQPPLSLQLKGLEEELGTRPAVVATGGDAALIARGVERIDHVDPDITLNGLRIAAVLNL